MNIEVRLCPKEQSFILHNIYPLYLHDIAEIWGSVLTGSVYLKRGCADLKRAEQAARCVVGAAVGSFSLSDIRRWHCGRVGPGGDHAIHSIAEYPVLLE